MNHDLQLQLYSPQSYMLANIFKRIPTLTQKYSFATAVTRDRVDYYRVLEVDDGATEQTIRKAYAALTRGLIPERDYERFRELNEAFVILTDNKTRDAYDSLLSVRKTNYLSPEQPKVPSTKSYLAERKNRKMQQTRKRLNIDQFGRFQGGLPNKTGLNRRGAVGTPDTMLRSGDIEEVLDNQPEYNHITTEKAESFKNFHQDQRKARQMKWPWFTFQVDYEYFKLTTFRKHYWPRFQLLIFLFYILPTFYYIYQRFEKESLTRALKAKAALAQESHQEHSSA